MSGEGAHDGAPSADGSGGAGGDGVVAPKVSTALVVNGRVVPTFWKDDIEFFAIKSKERPSWLVYAFGVRQVSDLWCMRGDNINILNELKSALRAKRGGRVRDMRLVDNTKQPIDEVTTVTVRGRTVTVLSRVDKGLSIAAEEHILSWLLQELWNDETDAKTSANRDVKHGARVAPAALPPLHELETDQDVDAESLHRECMALMVSSPVEHILWCPAKHCFLATYAPGGYETTHTDKGLKRLKSTHNVDGKRKLTFFVQRFNGNLEEFKDSLKDARHLALTFVETGVDQRDAHKQKLRPNAGNTESPSPITTDSLPSDEHTFSALHDTPTDEVLLDDA